MEDSVPAPTPNAPVRTREHHEGRDALERTARGTYVELTEGLNAFLGADSREPDRVIGFEGGTRWMLRAPGRGVPERRSGGAS